MRLVARVVHFPDFLVDISVIVLLDIVADPELCGHLLQFSFALPPLPVNRCLLASFPRIQVDVSSVFDARDGTGCLCGLPINFHLM
jgi:hypothetical protein